jgi:peptidyl-prolyl cis-trans isomerase SurA
LRTGASNPVSSLERLAASLAVILTLFSGALAEPEVVDRILAVVGNEIILLSEVDEEVYLAGIRERIDMNDPKAVQAYRAEILDAMIEQKILLEKAESEGVRVTREEINQAVEGMIQELRDRFPSEEAFESQLEAEGSTLDDLRADYRDRVEEQLMVRRLVDRNIRGRVTVEEREIQAYWDEHRDEIPQIPARLELRRILVSLGSVDAVDSASVERAEIVLRRLKSGEDFATLASVFSEGPTAERGGDLGWFALADLEPRLSNALSVLSAGETSDVILTDRGAHILKVEEIREGKLHLRQIVFLRDEEAARAGARSRVESILARIRAGQDFAELAKSESDDSVTRESGGYLGEVPIESLGPVYRPALEPLSPGEISEILEDETGFSIFRVDGREGERDPTYDEVRERLSTLIEQQKAQEVYVKYLEEAREETFVDNRLHSES